MVELQTNTKENKEKRKENDMSEMSWLSHLVTTDSRKELDKILKDKSEITDIEWIKEEPNAFEE